MKIKKVVFLILLGSFLFQSCKPDSWFEKLRYDKDQPYDVSVLHDVLEKTKGEENFSFIDTEEEFDLEIGKDSLLTNSSLISIGRNLYLDSIELEYLMKYVERGNKAFFFSKYFDYSLLDSLLNYYIDEEPEEIDSFDFQEWEEEEDQFIFQPTHSDYLESFRDTSATIELIGKSNESQIIYKRNRKIKLKNSWFYFNNDVLESINFKVRPIGFLGDSLFNFIRIDHGKGHFYLNTSPIILTNFHLIEDEFYDLTNSILEPLNSGKVFWDESLEVRNYREPSAPGGSERNLNEGPLAFILSEPSLKWAWYLLLIASFFYLLLGLRRKQKAIPVVHTNKNTSIEYAETIGQLHYQKKNHRNLVAIKMRHFRSFIVENYKIRVKYDSQDEKESIMKKISLHSNLDYTEIKHIFDQYEMTIGAGEVSKQLLVSFHDTLENFYKNCK